MKSKVFQTVKEAVISFPKTPGYKTRMCVFTATTLPGEAKVLIDPNTLSKDGTVALSGTAVTDDGKLIAYGLAVAGSDWQEWKIREIETGKDLSDQVKWVKFSGASWKRDGSGFFYSRYDAPARQSTEASQLLSQTLLSQTRNPAVER